MRTTTLGADLLAMKPEKADDNEHPELSGRLGEGMEFTRRMMLLGLGAAGFETVVSPLATKARASSLFDRAATDEAKCPFRLAVINDEITQDFEKACQIVAGDFGLGWIELRSMWNKNVTALSAKEVEDARKILEAHKLQVTDIASPLFKTDWPGA